jgi:hypothetical protein
VAVDLKTERAVSGASVVVFAKSSGAMCATCGAVHRPRADNDAFAPASLERQRAGPELFPLAAGEYREVLTGDRAVSRGIGDA